VQPEILGDQHFDSIAMVVWNDGKRAQSIGLQSIDGALARFNAPEPHDPASLYAYACCEGLIAFFLLGRTVALAALWLSLTRRSISRFFAIRSAILSSAVISPYVLLILPQKIATFELPGVRPF
jgi:hypothetical protein